jgi:ABC-2 type transport system ATP-binding protein
VDECAVTADGLCVVRGGVEVLHGISIEIAAGGVTGLLGPSGSGKTTLLRCILGLQRIASGTVQVLGRPNGDPQLRTEVGYATQEASVYEDLSVAQNLRYFAALLGTQSSDVDRVIEAVQLGAYADRLAGRLSGGQRPRVSLAAAMLGSPRLLVLDEPTVGLDPLLREDLWTLFHRVADDGVAVLVSSHVMDEADRCDRLLLLREGAVLAHDTPAALKDRTGAGSMEAAFLSLVRAG